jgi:heat shock protein HtpX
MSIFKLQLSMVGTLALIVGVSTLFFTVLLSLLGTVDLLSLAFMVVIMNIVQWLIAPYLIGAIYRVKEVPANEQPELHAVVNNLSQKLGIQTPKLMMAGIPVPNAFAYGSPLSGSRIAVTQGLTQNLEMEEVEAVIGHEMGHIKHRDVQIMMFVSVLPAIFYYIGYSLMWSNMLGGNRDRGGNNGAGTAALIGFASIALYFILNLFVLGLSRLREYYADRTSAENVDDGGRKLSEALAKIVTSTGKMKSKYKMSFRGLSSFKALLISDPDNAENDMASMSYAGLRKTDQQLVKEIMERPVKSTDKLAEVFSTHPNIVKRLKALQNA